MPNQPNVAWLFDTNALKMAPADSPFWLISGQISPYYINTQFLCGGEKKAAEILAFIDSAADDRLAFPARMLAQLNDVYHHHAIYRTIVDALVETIQLDAALAKVDFISGGQRRDWFFAPIVASKLGKTCLYIYNDLSIIDDEGKNVEDIMRAGVINVADLLTVGASYVKKWIPALGSIGGRLQHSVSVVDRLQGGEENLKQAGLKSVHALFNIDHTLFDEALKRNYISPEQFGLVKKYVADPYHSMRDFLLGNPQFMEASRASTNTKTKERVELMDREDLYNL